ncbi:hypothetical protein AYO21_05973 [Fonsecaea monophora]|uniref:Cytochrome P450 n=1 Tax=Fonsecaea monophora TaxID=254056 RepID=A0A177F661_9EURO|nr:hypothetical protein AYO21_05973 [Fonsecaea monophora]OAG39698.1 hypothetical protein AYO21_05973 [Fonsecaea monophora]
MASSTLDGFALSSLTTTVAILVTTWLLYLMSLALNRLYLSPLAKFPGPKAAALSRWYELYYEVVLKGQYSRRIDEMHQQYGPIVRVAPDELHIKDSDFFDELYVKVPRVDKHDWAAGRFGNHGSIITTADYALHRRRRAALNPFFSKRSIMDFQPVIRQKVEQLSRTLREYKAKGKPVVLSEAFPAFAGDIITEYSFGICYDHLGSPDFSESFHAAFMAVGEFGHVAVQFPWFHPLLNSLPDSLVRKMQPALGSLLQLQMDLRNMIKRLTEGDELGEGKVSHRTIFHDLLQSALPPEDKGNRRMADEAQTVIGGGLETTAWALSVASFHIVNTPRIYKRLHEELVQVMPDTSSIPDLLEVEKLPYLRACITEAVRLSYGISARNPRVLNQALQYKQWTIPPRTVVGMSIVDVHHDENIFPDSHSYIPERWLGNPKAPNGSPLDRYFVGFGKGSRSCLGINLAYAELFLLMAALFRRFRFELFETDKSDVELKHDFFLPSPKLDSKGVRVKVVEVFE